jgi:hypothetical protein
VLVLIAFAGLAVQLGGQIRITGLEGLAEKARESVDITLDENTLKLFGGFLSAGKSPEHPDQLKLQEMVKGLRSLTVKSFEFDREGQYRTEDLTPIRQQLQAPGWSKIVSVNGPREIAEIYTKMENGRTAGFAIIAAEPTELTVVLIDGEIDLAGLAALEGNFGIPEIPAPAGGKDGKNKKEE